MAKKLKSVPCSDWMLSWGLGTNHLGKLSLKDGLFTWKGHCQGRHGQILQKTFTVSWQDGTNLDEIGLNITRSELIKSINLLKKLNNELVQSS
jgi:hypothetical protein